MELGPHYHGKSRVRVAKIIRDGAKHRFVEYQVEVLLFGGTTASFLSGDNGQVISTDTCKNHVYMLAKTHPCTSPESFAISLVKRFLEEYPWLTMVRVNVAEKGWQRASVDGKEHLHGFERREESRGGQAEGDRGGNIKVVSKLEGVAVLKTTQSGWTGYVKDRFTTLPETTERILASVVSAEWGYRDWDGVGFERVAEEVKGALLRTFYGDVEKGVYSRGVQESLYKMGEDALGVEDLEWIRISMPNLHFLPCVIPVFEKNGVKFEDDVFIPTDEPHGVISAMVRKRRAKM